MQGWNRGNAFSKKLANLKAALALYFAWYNFVRVHRSLRVTPAMAAGVTDQVRGLEELLKAYNRRKAKWSRHLGGLSNTL